MATRFQENLRRRKFFIFRHNSLNTTIKWLIAAEAIQALVDAQQSEETNESLEAPAAFS